LAGFGGLVRYAYGLAMEADRESIAVFGTRVVLGGIALGAVGALSPCSGAPGTSKDMSYKALRLRNRRLF
jgi:hypothetical protein